MWQWVLGIAIVLLVLWGVAAVLWWLFALHPLAPLALISACAWWPSYIQARKRSNAAPLFLHFAFVAVGALGVSFLLRQPFVVGDAFLDVVTLGWLAFVALAAAAAIGWRPGVLQRTQVVAAGMAVLGMGVMAAHYYVAFPRGPMTPPAWADARAVAAPAITTPMREIGFERVDVVVAFYVDRRGRPRYLRVADNPSGDEAIAQAALDAVSNSVFNPLGSDGDRGYWANVNVRFNLR